MISRRQSDASAPNTSAISMRRFSFWNISDCICWRSDIYVLLLLYHFMNCYNESKFFIEIFLGSGIWFVYLSLFCLFICCFSFYTAISLSGSIYLFIAFFFMKHALRIRGFLFIITSVMIPYMLFADGSTIISSISDVRVEHDASIRENGNTPWYTKS